MIDLYNNIDDWKVDCIQPLNNEGVFRKAVIWNAGIYLWLADLANTIPEGMKKAETSLTSGSAKSTLNALIKWRKKIN